MTAPRNTYTLYEPLDTTESRTDGNRKQNHLLASHRFLRHYRTPKQPLANSVYRFLRRLAAPRLSRLLSVRSVLACSSSRVSGRSSISSSLSYHQGQPNRPILVYRLGEMPIQSCGQSVSAPRGKAGARSNAHTELWAKRQCSAREAVYRNRPITRRVIQRLFSALASRVKLSVGVGIESKLFDQSERSKLPIQTKNIGVPYPVLYGSSHLDQSLHGN